MELSERSMKDNDGLHPRTDRGDWAKTMEAKIREAAPFPLSYDVDSVQPADFTEYSYTEYMGGILLNTQSLEVNTRLMRAASEIKTTTCHIANLAKRANDKYVLEDIGGDGEFPKKIAFVVGQNMFDILSFDQIARHAFDDEDFFLKLHPLTDGNSARIMASLVGWNHILDNRFSGMQLLKKCATAYVTTASELCAYAVVFDKEIVNICNFFNEGIGIYYPINAVLFKTELADRKHILSNMIDCKYSGLIFPWMPDIDERIKAYYDKTLEYKSTYKNMAPVVRMKKTTINDEVQH